MNLVKCIRYCLPPGLTRDKADINTQAIGHLISDIQTILFLNKRVRIISAPKALGVLPVLPVDVVIANIAVRLFHLRLGGVGGHLEQLHDSEPMPETFSQHYRQVAKRKFRFSYKYNLAEFIQ